MSTKSSRLYWSYVDAKRSEVLDVAHEFGKTRLVEAAETRRCNDDVKPVSAVRYSNIMANIAAYKARCNNEVK